MDASINTSVTESISSLSLGPASPSQVKEQDSSQILLIYAKYAFGLNPPLVIEALFTRAYLWDKHLVLKSMKTSEDFLKFQAFNAEKVAQEVVQEAGDDKIESSDATKQLAEQAIPLEFHTAKTFINYKPFDNWLMSATFDRYWNTVGVYWLNRLVLYFLEKEITQDMKLSAEEVTQQLLPKRVLPQHGKLRTFTELIEQSVDLSANIDVNAKIEHLSEFLQKYLKCGFEAAKGRQKTKKCRNFLRKLTDLGFASGFDNKTFRTPEDVEDSSDESPDEASTKTPTPDDRFSDIYYEVHDYVKMPMIYGVKNEETSTGASDEPEGVSTNADSEVSLDFDPNRDSHLIAKEAYKIFKHDTEIRKYWFQRYRLFSKLDDGVLLDREGWFSVTPEAIAEHIAERMVRAEDCLIVDGFAGVGGNTIQFALKGARVIAVDLDPIRLKCAKRNAEIYGVADRIEFVCNDFFKVLRELADDNAKKVDAIFLSPPWGGPSYIAEKEFDLGTGCTPNGFDIFESAQVVSPNIAYYLPRNTKISQLQRLARASGAVEIEQSTLNKKVKAITAYYGDLRRKDP